MTLYLYWLEALSLCGNMSDGMASTEKLDALLQVLFRSVILSVVYADITNRRTDTSALTELVRDARRFIMYHKLAIENSPLQAYSLHSCLVQPIA